VYMPKAPLNPFNFSDPVSNRLYYTGLRAADPPKYWKQLWQRTVTQAFFINICSTDAIRYFNSKRITGVKFANWLSPFSAYWAPAW